MPHALENVPADEQVVDGLVSEQIIVEAIPASADWSAAPKIEDVRVNAAITATRRTTHGLYVRGYALTGQGAGIECVEASCDDGQTWRRATLEPEERRWAWRLWFLELPGPVVYDHLLVRARDGHGRWQPDDLNSTWNFHGCLNDAWHRISINSRESV